MRRGRPRARSVLYNEGKAKGLPVLTEEAAGTKFGHSAPGLPLEHSKRHGPSRQQNESRSNLLNPMTPAVWKRTSVSPGTTPPGLEKRTSLSPSATPPGLGKKTSLSPSATPPGLGKRTSVSPGLRPSASATERPSDVWMRPSNVLMTPGGSEKRLSVSPGERLAGSAMRPSVSSGAKPSGLGVRPSVSAGTRSSGLGVRPSVSAGTRSSGLGVRPSVSAGTRSAGLGVRPSASAGARSTGLRVRPSVSAGANPTGLEMRPSAALSDIASLSDTTGVNRERLLSDSAISAPNPKGSVTALRESVRYNLSTEPGRSPNQLGDTRERSPSADAQGREPLRSPRASGAVGLNTGEANRKERMSGHDGNGLPGQAAGGSSRKNGGVGRSGDKREARPPASQPEPPSGDRPVFKFYTSNFDSDDVVGRVTVIEVNFVRGTGEVVQAGDEATPSGDILAIGGVRDKDDIDGITIVQRYVRSTSVWEKFSETPKPRLNFAVAFLNKCLYVVGGYDPRQAKDGIHATKETFQFDLSTMSWTMVGEMGNARAFHAVCCLGERLYALGGQDESVRALNTVELFDLSAGKWSPTAPMTRARVGASCVVIQGQIMISGGYGEPVSDGAPCPVLMSTELFDPSTNQWEEKAQLRVARAQACMVAVNGCVYLCGGVTRDPISGFLCSIRDVDKYNSYAEEWEHITDLQTARHNAGATAMGSKIYIVGGVSTDTNQVLRSVECYDTQSDTWDFTVPDLPRGAKSLSCVVIPQGIA